MRSYKKIIFTTGSEAASEILLARLDEEGFYAFEIEGDQLTGYIETPSFDEKKLRNSLEEAINFRVETIPDQNWNEEWEKSFSPVIISNLVAIRANFQKPVANTRYDIVITPKMSFGTGHHATTHLMVSAMSRLDLRKKKVVDFGTGTGVLAILARKMGAEAVTAVDNDTWSVENSKENISANGCNDIKIIKASNLDDTDAADIVLANINKNVLLQHAGALADHLPSGGILIISGFLLPDYKTLAESFQRSGFILISDQQKNEWVAMTLQKA